jgi:hypothetical protein
MTEMHERKETSRNDVLIDGGVTASASSAWGRSAPTVLGTAKVEHGPDLYLGTHPSQVYRLVNALGSCFIGRVFADVGPADVRAIEHRYRDDLQSLVAG